MDKGKRITGAARDNLAAELKTAYESGASIRSIADSTKRSYGFVHHILTEAGVTLRGRGEATRNKPSS
ncbi:helix-turn-helix domain-containing protein [Streptomyces sp. AcE210]|uniref:helix-turn-helix domain-containing protein n=1 Tax=Streptomyces sp. AcE210 TaxID=2292703 RepID=UPI000E308A38|nr:helix-turn-helix domain-containing protein [Streptomyces sp. AcE210]RFC78247.1 transcriptional regulator [Streptomyces sp. AcE210]